MMADLYFEIAIEPGADAEKVNKKLRNNGFSLNPLFPGREIAQKGTRTEEINVLEEKIKSNINQFKRIEKSIREQIGLADSAEINEAIMKTEQGINAPKMMRIFCKIEKTLKDKIKRVKPKANRKKLEPMLELLIKTLDNIDKDIIKIHPKLFEAEEKERNWISMATGAKVKLNEIIYADIPLYGKIGREKKIDEY